MSRQTTTLTVFVASASDVWEERDRLEKAISSINVMMKATGIQYELIRWERDVSPSLGEDAQDVINTQTPDYDIFIGILWHRIGSPTKRYESGVVEEYELAKERLVDSPDDIKIMFYVKRSTPNLLSDINPEQLQMVTAFVSRISDDGAFYSKFDTPEEFGEKVSADLIKHINGLAYGDDHEERTSLIESRLGSDPVQETEISEERDDEGLIELHEKIEDHVAALDEIVAEIVRAMEDVANSAKERTKSIERINARVKLGKMEEAQQRRMVREEAKRIARDMSLDMNQFAGRVRNQLSSFDTHLNSGLALYGKIIPVYLEFEIDRNVLKNDLCSTLEAQRGLLQAMQGFRESIDGIPKLSTALGRSKRDMSKAVDDFIRIVEEGVPSVEGALSLLG